MSLTNKNPLDQFPEVRSLLYLAQWILNGVLGAIGVVLVSLGLDPLWYVITTAVLNFVWSYVGLTANRNLSVPEFNDLDITALEADNFWSEERQ